MRWLNEGSGGELRKGNKWKGKNYGERTFGEKDERRKKRECMYLIFIGG